MHLEIFTVDLRHGNVGFKVPSVPLADTAGIRFLQPIHADPNRTRWRITGNPEN